MPQPMKKDCVSLEAAKRLKECGDGVFSSFNARGCRLVEVQMMEKA